MLSQHTALANKYESIFRAPQINSACFKILFLFIMQAFCDMNNMHPYLRITVSKSNSRTRSNPLIPTRFAICGPSRPCSKTLRPTVPFFFSVTGRVRLPPAHPLGLTSDCARLELLPDYFTLTWPTPPAPPFLLTVGPGRSATAPPARAYPAGLPPPTAPDSRGATTPRGLTPERSRSG